MDLLVNDVLRVIKSPPETPLLWVLRDELDLTGTKYGCGTGACGVCTVHVEGAAIPSCSVPVGQLEGTAVTTIEGLKPEIFAPIAQAWLDAGASQCGYCQPGMIMALAPLLGRTPRPTAAAVTAALKVLCRCGSYPAMRRALRALLA